MNSTTYENQSIPINPRILRWARERAGRTIEEAAKRVHVKKIDQIQAWEDEKNEKSPTVRQARLLAKYYNRSFLELFRQNPPDLPEPELIPDFRLYRHVDDPPQLRDRRDIQLWAEAQRENALNLYRELGDAPPGLPDSLFATTGANIENKAADVREALGFSIKEQTALKSSERYLLPGIIRKKIEKFGVLTLRNSGLKYIGSRGFCIAVFPLPVIVFGSEAPAAQAFTLIHELGHVLLRQSALSGPITREGGPQKVRKIEEWCNRFASAFLMPEEEVAKILRQPDVPVSQITDESLELMAAHFGVSEHAALIRLVNLKYVQSEYYWNVKKPEFDEREKEYKPFGRAAYYGSRYRGSLGDLYTSLVIEAWSAGRITNHNAAEYMGIKKLTHLNDIRENF